MASGANDSVLDKGHYVFIDNYTSERKKFLTEKFQQGERSGRKSDPTSVARSMMSAVDSQEKRMFSSEEFLTASQVAGFFSRLAAKKSLFNDDVLEEEIECATQEATIEELTSEVSRQLLLGHPITWDKYNLCQITSGGKLNTTKLSVAKLRDNFAGLDIAVDVSIKRSKQPCGKAIVIFFIFRAFLRNLSNFWYESSICCVLTSQICLEGRQMLYMDITVFTPLNIEDVSS